ncbi:hypothetical protein [Natranaerofaba carboxydovora]|uniref:hypothetical protein n=1 Tax=Natranaerofaba carboxydovora TaxID=2742683 RepID=UPI003B845A62
MEVGGKLGRHPRFAKKLVNFVSQREAVATIEKLIDLYTKNMGEEFERFSEYVERVGVKGVLS